jgi:GT2 family glycosyltransferase
MPLDREPDPTAVKSFQPLGYPLVFDQPRRLTDVDSWHEHIPLAFFAVAALEPKVLVELGTWKGDSYCAFCQAVQTLGLPTRCYAVDTWQGDEHTGFYGPEVLEELRAYHDPLYGSFSRLLPQTFDESATQFADGSIDLLHVDGYHTYDVVAHDIQTWLPKLSARGVVLLHDTNVREGSFGVWRLWEELSPRYPGVAFAHGHGLGVLAVGHEVDARFRNFIEAAAREPLVARFFAALGERIAAPARERRARAAVEEQLRSELRCSYEARAAADAEAVSALRDADAARAAAERDAEERLQVVEESRAERDRLVLERDRLESQVRAREADLTAVVRSASWRVTAPLRAAKRKARRVRHMVRRLRRPPFPGVRSARSAPIPAAVQAPAPPLLLRPLVTVVTPVYNTDPKWLARAVESVRSQTYRHWQLCLVDDGSTNEPTLDYLRSLTDDEAIDVVFGEVNRGIAAATNRALEAAEGEFVAFLDHDDELDTDALLECVRLLNKKPETDAIYTDEDKVDRRGMLSEPFFKPDWSPELFRGVMYVGHLLVLRRSLVESVGGLDSTFDGVQDFELMLRASERTDRIEHVPRILYHWRKLPHSVAASVDAKEGISELQAAAVNRHLERSGIAAFARPNPALPHRTMLHPKPRSRWPPVTVIVPTKDATEYLGRCLESIFSRSTYPNFDVLLVDNGTTDPDALKIFDRHPVDVLPFDGPFNFSRVNNLGAAHAGGDFVLFLNNDTEVQTPEWLETIVSLAEPDGVGAVGPLLLYPNGKVQHAGVVLGLRGTADHIMRGFPATADGYAGSLSCTREVSAVTAACMLMRRRLFVDLGGFDEHFATHYQDVDLCLRIGRSGRRILYTPRAVLRHHESATRGDQYDHFDRALLLDAWGETIARGDPYYNQLLSLSGADYQPRAATA